MFKNNFHSAKEAEYQSYLKSEKIRYTRVLCLMSAILYASFMLVDLWSLSSNLGSVYLIRGAVILTLVMGYFFTFMDRFDGLYNLVLPIVYLIATSGILAMVHFSTPSDIAFEEYYVGIILLLFALFVWTYLKLKISISLAVFSITGYVLIETYGRADIAQNRIPIMLTNLFFLGSAMVLGFMVQVMRDGYLRQNFLLQKSLHAKVEKTEEEARTQEHLANHDQLTGLPNRRFSEENLDGFMTRVQELDLSLVIMYLDLNGFKKINDTYGHDAGDEVLRIAAKRIKSCVRYGDCLARLGGDEFSLGLIVDKYDTKVATEIAKKITHVLEQPIGYDGIKLNISTSIGIASAPEDGSTVAELMELADKRMYVAKIKSKREAQKNQSNKLNKNPIAPENSEEIAPDNIASRTKSSEQDQDKQASVLIFPG